MKRKILGLTLLLLAALTVLSSCGGAPTLRFKNGVYTNKKTNISYTHAPSCYQAIAYHADQEVAKIEQKGMEDIILYAVDGVDPSRWLTTENYELLYAVGTTLPALWEMNVSTVYVNQSAEISFAVATVKEATTINALIEVYQSGVSFPQSHMEKGLTYEKYDLVFQSEHLRYCLAYWQFEEEVLIYEPISSLTDFEILYPGVEVTTEVYDYTENGVAKQEYLAVYHFGKGIVYNRETGLCYPVGTLISDYLA